MRILNRFFFLSLSRSNNLSQTRVVRSNDNNFQTFINVYRVIEIVWSGLNRQARLVERKSDGVMVMRDKKKKWWRKNDWAECNAIRNWIWSHNGQSPDSLSVEKLLRLERFIFWNFVCLFFLLSSSFVFSYISSVNEGRLGIFRSGRSRVRHSRAREYARARGFTQWPSRKLEMLSVAAREITENG